MCSVTVHIADLSVIPAVQCHAVVPEMLEEVRQDLLTDVLRFNTICTAALLHDLKRKTKEKRKKVCGEWQHRDQQTSIRKENYEKKSNSDKIGTNCSQAARKQHSIQMRVIITVAEQDNML